METLKIKKLNEVYFYIHATEGQTFELNEYFQLYANNFQYHPLFKKRLWNGKIHFYNPVDSTLPIGLYSKLIDFCTKYKYELKLEFNSEELKNNIEDEEFDDMYKAIFNEEYYPRDYQDTCIKLALREKRGIIESVTGSGKSMVIYSIIRFLLATQPTKKILLIVPNISLVNQMFSDFKSYGFTDAENYVSLLYGNSKQYDKDKPILCSTWQSIYKRPQFFFKDFVGVIVDEVHLAKGKSLQSTLKKCTNADYRIGLTGTLPENEADLMTIYGYLGSKLHSVGYGELIDKGVLAKINIANVIVKYPDDIIKYNRGRPYQEESDFITKSDERNKVFKYIISHIKTMENILILCSKIEHLQAVKKYVELQFPDRKVYEIYGKIDPIKREAIRKNMNNEEGVILIGTYATMSTGINIKKIHHVIFGSSYKSKIKVLQSIGRGLRTHESKKKLILWDIVDDMCFVKKTGKVEKNYIYKHFEERYRYYKEIGFKCVNNIKKLEDL